MGAVSYRLADIMASSMGHHAARASAARPAHYFRSGFARLTPWPASLAGSKRDHSHSDSELTSDLPGCPGSGWCM